MDDMGKKIREIRMQKGMTLEQLGEKVGVGKSTIRKWETGMIENMKRDKIAKIAMALDVDPGYLMGWEDSPNTQMRTYIVDTEEGRTRFEIETMLDDFSGRQLKELKRYIEFMMRGDDSNAKS